MFSDVKPSHLILLFLSGALSSVMLIPPILGLLDAQALRAPNIMHLYGASLAGMAQAALPGVLAGIAAAFFVGILLDGQNVIAHEQRWYGSVYEWVGRRWGQTKRLEYIANRKGLRARDDDPHAGESSFWQQRIWQQEHETYEAMRGWQFFISHAYDLLILMFFLWTLVLLVVCTVRVAWLGLASLGDFRWLVAAVVLYVAAVPGAIFHRYHRVRIESFLESRFREDTQATTPSSVSPTGRT